MPEAITWTLLIAALVTRAVAGVDVAVTVAGGIHGFVFLAYGATAVLLAVHQRWHPAVAAVAIAAAVVVLFGVLLSLGSPHLPGKAD